MEVKTTRLRFIKAESPFDLINAVESLDFKVEIKGAPIRDKNGWVLFFVIPDNVNFKSVDLG